MLLTSVLFSVFESTMTHSHNETSMQLFLILFEGDDVVFLECSKSGVSLTLKIAFNVSLAILVDTVCESGSVFGLPRRCVCVCE